MAAILGMPKVRRPNIWLQLCPRTIGQRLIISRQRSLLGVYRFKLDNADALGLDWKHYHHWSRYQRRGKGCGTHRVSMNVAPPKLTDEELMVQVQQGHQVALSALYERYASRVYGMALQKLADPAEAADVTHDIFVNLWQRSSTFQPARGLLRSWLLTVAHNQIVDTLRREQRAREAYEAIARDPVAVSEVSREDTAASAEQNAEAQLVRRALQTLPPDQREVVVLSYYQGYSQSEISQRLQTPLGTIKSRMRLAMTKLRDELRSDVGNR